MVTKTLSLMKILEIKQNSDKNNNVTESMFESMKKGLFDMFGEDALVKKSVEIKGITLDKSHIEDPESSYRMMQRAKLFYCIF